MLKALAAAVVLFVVCAAPARAETVPVSPAGSIVITAHGNGHGHGMSQYGARGAAIAGGTYQRIVAFYYPHTQLATLGASHIRVKVSGFGGWTTISAAPGLTVSNVGAIGGLDHRITYWRLLADHGSTMSLDYLRPGSGWTTYRAGLRSGTAFFDTTGAALRLWRSDGSSVGYLGAVRAWRNAPSGASAGLYKVNETSLDLYTAGVTPREMPATWQAQAVRAQAVAARTYGRYHVEHPYAASYDICDTTACQVYGGHVAYDAAGDVRYTDDVADAVATSNQVLLYGGHAIFAQFAASDGGWTVSGGQPYLIAQADPFDDTASGDPYLTYTRTVSVASVARSLGLATLTGITITSRDGHGVSGGRVLAGYADGTDSAKHAKRVDVDGFDLQGAFGLGTTWFTLAAK